MGATSKNEKVYTKDEVTTLVARVLVGAFLAGLWTSGYFNVDARYFSVIYPNKDDLTEHISIGRFADSAECSVQSLKMLEQLGWGKKGTYRCSTQCNGSDNSPAHCL